MALDIISGRNGGYPCIAELDELAENADLNEPYPQYAFVCSGGYPVIPALSGGFGLCFSELYSADRPVTELYFGDNKIYAVYLGDDERYVYIE
ncbi:MAG: hypothetical protein IJ874_00020 [Ruminococcus sp.]|nr:hypothetical protein [Ruminococcus sp.]